MSSETDVDPLSFAETIPRLAPAPLAGIAVLASWYLPRGPRDVLLVALYMAPFCYGAAVLFVLPVLAIWPRSRRPSYPVCSGLGHLLIVVFCHVAHVGSTI